MIRKLILHAGTPKTGTTSLQVYLDRERGTLLRHGIFYPKTDESAEPAKPKHQWIVNTLMASDNRHFCQKIDKILAEAGSGPDTMILSTEGLFNHWWDFSTAGRQALAALTREMAVQMWVWFREPISFIRSNYVQMLRNPRSWVECCGRDISIEQMLDDQWFIKHLDYIGFVRQVESVLGRGAVVPFAYRGDTIKAFLGALGLTGMPIGGLAEHPTSGELGVTLLRILNRYELTVEQKKAAVVRIGELDALVGAQSQPLRLAAATVRQIHKLAAESMHSLSRDFGLSFASPPDEDAGVPEFLDGYTDGS